MTLAKNGMIFMPFYIIVLFGIPTIKKTIKLKHEMTPEVRRIHEFFIRIEKGVKFALKKGHPIFPLSRESSDSRRLISQESRQEIPCFGSCFGSGLTFGYLKVLTAT